MLKHVGRMVKNQRGVVVAYKVVPGEPDQSIIVDTSSLMAEEHDSLIKAVEDAAGQEAEEFATVMARTRLPDGSNMLANFHSTGKLTKNEALIFGIVSSFVSVGALYFFSNVMAAALLALTILFYVFVYTIWLKRKTPQNIVIGGAAGALPPVIGWAIATGGISIEPIILFLIIFVWTPSHFWALSLFKSEDYKKANIPMLPVTSGVETTKKNIFAYSILLFPVAVAPYYLEFLGIIYLLFSFPLSAYYVFICYKLLKTKDKKSEKSISKQIFAFSILY